TRFADRPSIFSLVLEESLPIAAALTSQAFCGSSSRTHSLLFGIRSHRRKNAAVRTKAKEFFSRGITSVRWKAEASSDQSPYARPHSFPGNVFKIEIPAARAVGISGKGDCYAPGVEPEVAGVAAPRPQTGDGSKKIEKSASVRSKTARTAALRTDHSFSHLLRESG